MEIVLLKMLFIASVSAQIGKHVFVLQRYDWNSAQNHCRHHYTDLSPISKRDEVSLKNATDGKFNGEFWIGLYNNGAQSEWMWSGGGNAGKIPWAEGQPDDQKEPNVTSVCWHKCTKWTGWHNVRPSVLLPFFCFKLIIMEDKKTWEEALEYCSQNHTALTSLTSKTEHLLALSKLKNVSITERVWIGLRYLGDRWLWVDGNPLVYKAWYQEDEDFQCPMWKRCGALTREGLWESLNCQDKLSFICY